MTFPSIIQKLAVSVLFFTFSVLHSTTISGQDKKSVVDTIEYIIKNKKSTHQLCDDLNALGKYYLESNKVDFAELTTSKARELAMTDGYEKGIYDAFATLGSIALQMNEIEKGESIVNEWLDYATRNNSDHGKNGANYLLIKIYYKQGKMDSVISISKRILETERDSYDSLYLPKVNGMLGNVYLKQGDYRNANLYYIKALTIAEKTNNELIQSACIGNLAIINKELKNYREALHYHRKALVLRLKNNQLQDVAGTYNNMATCYENLKMPDSAVFYFKKALVLFNQFDSKENVAMVNNNLGQLMVDKNQLDSGMYYLQAANKQFMILKDSINLAYNSWALGDAWWEISYWKEDKSYLDKALAEMLKCKSLAELQSMEDLKMNSYKSLSLIYDSKGNESQAYHYLKKYNELNDSIRSKDYTNQIAEMQTKYETEKKEIAIGKLNSEKLLDTEKIARQKLLNYSLAIIASLILLSAFLIFRNVQKKRIAEKQIALLEKQNAIETMRGKIASDVHDDMGANLTRIGLYSQQLLQTENISGKEKQLLEKISIQSKEVITGMKEIIWASNPAHDNLKSMLGFMRQYIDRFFDGTEIRTKVNFPQNVGEVILHPEVRRNLFLILKESLHNAIKYSGSDKIDIDFNAEGDRFNFSVKDYGKGIDDKLKDEFSNGMRNMRLRAEQIQAAFKMVSAPGSGVQVLVEGKLY